MSGLLRDNWSGLLEEVKEIQASLAISSDEIVPINKLAGAKTKATDLKRKIQRENLYIVGNTNILKGLTMIQYRVDGLQYALRTKELNAKTMQSTLASTQKILDPMIDDISSKIHKTELDKFVDTVKVEGARELSDTEFDNLTDAMQAVVRKSNSEGDIATVDKSQTRDLLQINNLMSRNKADLAQMRETLAKAKSSKNHSENFSIVYGPVLTAANLESIRLKAAGVDFDTIYYPGIKYGFQRKEPTPRMYVLRNQLLIAVVVKDMNRFQFKFKGKPLAEKMEDETKRFDEISGDVASILYQRLGEEYMQVGAELHRYITNKEFPGVKFMWMLKKSVYTRIGAFGSSNTLELPF